MFDDFITYLIYKIVVLGKHNIYNLIRNNILCQQVYKTQ